MRRPLFLPTARQTNWLLIVAFLSVGEALYIRYMAIENLNVELACQAGLKTWLCGTFRLSIVLFNHDVFGGVALVAALLNLIRRVDLPPFRAVVNTLMQTERYGTPLAHSLRVLASEFRDERMMRAEEKAARLPAIMTVPMILFILPTLFIVLIGPAIIQVMETFHMN